MSLTAVSGMSDAGLQSIGKYRIVGTLGRGSMGIVYKARDPEIGRFVAIKTLRKISSPQFQDTSLNLERFKLEARSAGNLRHPNIITVFDVNVEGDLPYIVMDYVEGESLDQIISRLGRLEPAQMLHYISEAASGLDYAHTKGVIHRDVKPSNIIVDKAQRVFILDFGIASMNESFSESEAAAKKNQPILGTPGYMSPEQILNENLDQRSDVFSLAVVAFECLTGKRPFPGDNFTQVVGNILNGKPLSLTALAPELPLALEAEFEKALAKNRGERFESASSMINAFRDALGIKFLNSSEAGLSERMPGRRKRVSTWKSLSSLTQPRIGKGPEEVRQQAESNPEPDYHPIWTPQSGVPEGGGPPRSPGTSENPFLPQTRDVLARNVNSVGRGSLEYRAPLTFGRFALLVIGFICIFSAGYLFWNMLNPPVEQAAAPAASKAIERSLAVNHFENLPETDLEIPKVDPVPSGKTVEEMSDKEVLGVLASQDKEISEAMKVSAIRESLNRKLIGFVGISLVPLQSDSYIVRLETIKALAQFGDKRIVPRLVVSLDDYDPIVRAQAAKALGQLGSRAALGYLSARALKEDRPEVKAAIEIAVRKITGLN